MNIMTTLTDSDLDNLFDQCNIKSLIYDTNEKNIKIRSIIFKFCKDNEIFLDKLYNFRSYTIYSYEPFKTAINLTNELLEIIPHVKMNTFLYREEFCIYDIYNQLVIIKSTPSKDKNLLMEKLQFETLTHKNINVKTYSKNIYAIYYFSDLYKPKNYDLSTNENFILNTKSVKLFKNIPIKVFTHENEIFVKKQIFQKIKKLDDVIHLDYYAYKLLKNKKINYKYNINIIYKDPKKIINYITNSFNKLFTISYKEHDVQDITDFRLSKINVYAKYKNYKYLVMTIYNSTSYEIMPVYKLKHNILIAHKFVFNKFMFLHLLNLTFYTNGFAINKYISYFLKYNKVLKTDSNKNIDFVGVYKDINYSKKIYNTTFNTNPYIPSNKS